MICDAIRVSPALGFERVSFTSGEHEGATYCVLNARALPAVGEPCAVEYEPDDQFCTVVVDTTGHQAFRPDP